MIQLHSDEVLDLLENISELSSKTDKENLIREYWENRLFKMVLCSSLDPFITFGMNKLPKTSHFGDEEFSRETLELLQNLRDRLLTGNAAKDAVKNELERLTPKSSELLSRIIKRNLKAGFSESTVNKVFPNTIYVFKNMLAHPFDDYCHEIEWPAFAEIKEDGVRGFCLENKSHEYVSRNGLPLYANEELKAQSEILMSCWRKEFVEDADCLMVIDSEMVEASDDFNDSVSGARKKGGTKTMQIKVIDILTQNEFDSRKSRLVYSERREKMKDFFFKYGEQFPRISLTDAVSIQNEAHAREYFKRVHDSGKEGLIVKVPNGLWEGKRSKNWLKMKGLIDKDLVVKELVPGEEGKEFEHLMGAAICDYENSKGKTVEVRIGGGWSIEERAQHWANYHDEPVTYYSKKGNETIEHVIEPNGEMLVGQVIQVHAHEETKDGSLRHPRYIKIRTDKSAEDGQGC
ncbi:putative DNA ligase (ATP) [Vibrio coralliirubri]|uniref:ATP-dependent DNA ligase n=1 Tax=Vibrio coralliirubri TaxID=1516159 RepID=UPI000631126C|nr:hypothetical protein [Vibrio coralliirubri]CDT53861.1 putative DNA ligase (ATP) [Vibrio coralliirubri]